MTEKKRRKGDGRVAFLANADKFKKLLNAGHTQRAIYDDHPAAIANVISYAQFNRYVGKYLLAKEPKPKESSKDPKPSPTPNQTTSTAPAKKQPPTKFGFFMPIPNRDDLI